MSYLVKVRLLQGKCAGSELEVNVPVNLFGRVLELEEQGLLQVLTAEYLR